MDIMSLIDNTQLCFFGEIVCFLKEVHEIYQHSTNGMTDSRIYRYEVFHFRITSHFLNSIACHYIQISVLARIFYICRRNCYNGTRIET